MRFGSVCSGIEAASVAWHPLGWECAFVSEIEAFPRAVLAHHYPTVPNWGDMTKFQEWPDADIDLLVGGTPCQSFSVAGLRKGLADPRGNLALTYLAIAHKYRPEWVVWENVPGVLSSAGGRDFGAFLGGLGELGYGWAYRVLDAQYFGVAQRRRRVFVVGCLGGWQRAAAVLFERHSLQGYPAPRRETRQTAPTLPVRSTAGGGLGTDFDCDRGLIQQVANPLTARMHNCVNTTCDEGQTMMITHTLRGEGFDASEDGTGRGVPIVFHPTQDPISGIEVCHAISANENATAAVAFSLSGSSKRDFHIRQVEASACLGARSQEASESTQNSITHIVSEMRVRRLTPRECERLQGFPDDYTAIPWRGKPAADCPDGPRYKALGNSMAVPVMRWIGQRLQQVVDCVPVTSSDEARHAAR